MLMTTSDLEIGPPIPYQSPFPTYNSPQAIAKLDAMASQLSNPNGYMSMLQADAWQSTQRLNNRYWLTSDEIGGAPIRMLREMLPTDILENADIEATLVEGADILATAVFSSGTDPAKFAKAMGNVGLNVAMDAMTQIPIWGILIKGFITVGRFMAKLAKKAKEDREEAERIIPWFSYDKSEDEDSVDFISKAIIPTVDWSQIWRTPFSTSFDIEPTGMGAYTAAWAPFSQAGPGLTALPVYSGGMGMLPGMQQGIDVMQCGRVYPGPNNPRDVITNAADYRPNVLQQAMVSWSMMNNFGSPLMFQARARELGEEWEAWWDGFFEEGLDRLNSASGYQQVALAKILARWLCFKVDGNWNIGLAPAFVEKAENLYAFIDKDIFSQSKNKLVPGRQYYTPAKIIKKACRDLAKSQISALGRTPVSALVRPHSTGGRPRFGAFEDKGPPMKSLQEKGYNQSTFGEQLIAYTDYVRDILVDHPEKYKLDKRDVEAVDPSYSEKLGILKPGSLMPVGIQLTAFPPGGQDTEPPPEPTGPVGLPPFSPGKTTKEPPKRKTSSKTTVDIGKNVAIGVVVVGGALAYKHRDTVKEAARTAVEKIKGVYGV